MPNPELLTLNDGHEIPQIGLGTFGLTGDDARRTLLAAFEAGYRHIDTAAFYDNEAAIGKAIAESGLAREEIWVTTKVWNNEQGRDESRVSLERSLENLGLDHVDLFLIHWPCPAQDRYIETWEAFIDFRSEGLATSIGVSNFLAEHIDNIVDETGINPAVNQIELHPTFQPHDLINHCSDMGILVASWSPLGDSKDLGHPEIIRIAEETGATPAQVIIAWHLHRGFVTIPKTSKPERLQANLAALDVKLNSEHLETIDGLATGRRVGDDPADVEP